MTFQCPCFVCWRGESVSWSLSPGIQFNIIHVEEVANNCFTSELISILSNDLSDRVVAFEEQQWGESLGGRFCTWWKLVQLAWTWLPGLFSTVPLSSWWRLFVCRWCCRVPSIPVFMCATLNRRLSCSQSRWCTDSYRFSAFTVSCNGAVDQ